MTGLLDKLNLRPQERRLLVGVAMVVFIVLNVLYVWPHFQDWGRAQKALADKERELAEHRAEVDRLPEHQALLDQLKGDAPAEMTPEQGAQLMRIVQPLATRNGVVATEWTPGVQQLGTQSKFFEEQTLRIAFNNTGDKEIVNFLLALSADNSAIRVRDLDLKPDQSGIKLMGSIVVVASYRKDAPPGDGAAGQKSLSAAKQ